jgi:hypothetical protein
MKRKAKTAARRTAQKSANKPKAARAAKVAKKAAATPRDATEALVEAGAKALGLQLDPGWRPSIAFNLQLILRHAALVEEFSLPDDAEPAPVYHA